jgi:hypothetical protein
LKDPGASFYVVGCLRNVAAMAIAVGESHPVSIQHRCTVERDVCKGCTEISKVREGEKEEAAACTGAKDHSFINSYQLESDSSALKSFI